MSERRYRFAACVRAGDWTPEKASRTRELGIDVFRVWRDGEAWGDGYVTLELDAPSHVAADARVIQALGVNPADFACPTISIAS